MAVESIEVYPTCDIHLLLQGPGGAPTTYQLEVRDYSDGTNLTGDVVKTSYRDHDLAIADVLSTGLIKPVAVGETFCRIRHEDMDLSDPDHPKTFVSEMIARIRVHQRLDTFWIGNNQVTLLAGQDNYVLSVYGVFDDGTIGDISCHPFLAFSSANTGKVKVNNTDDKGRLSAVAVTGDTPVEIGVSFDATTKTVNAFVSPGLSTPRRIVERIQGSGSVDDHRNILFLADGFTAAQKPLFKTIVTLIKDALFTARVHSPYDVLKDRFNVWLAFEPSPEEGASAGDWVVKTGTGPFGTFTGKPIAYRTARPTDAENYTLGQLILRVGLPDRYHPIPSTRLQARQAFLSLPADSGYAAAKLEDDVLDAWLLLRDYFQLQAKDSFFGSMNGYRRGDRSSKQIAPNVAAESLMHWYLADEQPHALGNDRRRLARDWNPYVFRDAYLRSLRVADTNADISRVWVQGKDRSLVVMLVNSAFDGGQRSERGVNVSARGNTSYSELHIAGHEADHGVPEILILPSLPALVGSSVEEISSVLAHELAHSFALGDEYEGSDYAGTHDVLLESDAEARTSIAKDNNLVHYYSIGNPAGGPGRIDMDRVKWRLWHRIAQASVLTEEPDVLTGNQLSVQVPPAERGKWESARADGADVFLRSRNINADLLEVPSDDDSNDDDRWFLEGPLKVQDVQTDGTVILTGSSFDVFEDGDVLYRALVENGAPLSVFHPDVLLDLEVFGGPFAKKDDPTKPEKGAAYPPERLATTAPNLQPRHAALVVAVYEGGGTYNSRVYRPSGMCKMRNTSRSRMREKPLTIDPQGTPVVGPEREVKQFVPFCYVCRYTIVNAVDPTFLDQLVYPD